jgi:hypothetical protein
MITLGLAAGPATADEVYLGTAKGTIDIWGGAHKWHYKDKQYRGTSLPDTRHHIIRVTYKGCQTWTARAAVKRPGGGGADTDSQKVRGCNKTALVTVMGSKRAKVTLSIHLLSGDSKSAVIKPV